MHYSDDIVILKHKIDKSLKSFTMQDVPHIAGMIEIYKYMVKEEAKEYGKDKEEKNKYTI